VTSPTQGDGKTATAANLAAALALSGDRVVAVDADLRHAGLSEAFGIDRSVGLTSLVLGSAELDEVLQQRTPNLAVLATGPLPPNPSEILGSQLVHRVLSEIAARADVVVIDAPPVLPVADALVLAPQVDGVVLVVRHGKTLRHAAAEAARRLEAIGAPFIGYVLNGVPRGESRGIYADDRYTAANERPPVVRDSGRRAARGVNGLRTSTPPSVDVPARSPARTGVVSRHGRETVVPDPATRRSARRRDQERE
jgi:capsular exopolysaccharide synthesis family protein